jgi:hypothetical protein
MELLDAIRRLVEYASNAISGNHADSRDLVLSSTYSGDSGEPVESG